MMKNLLFTVLVLFAMVQTYGQEEIDVKGNGLSIINGNTPDVSNDTDFGDVIVGSSVTKTFTIENLGNANLTINFFFTSGTDYTFAPPGGGGILLIPGATTTIDATFLPQGTGVLSGVITINSTDADEGTYIINLSANGVQPAEIDVKGNGISISSGNTPSVLDDTDFGQVEIGSPVTNTFTIENVGGENLTINFFFTSGTGYTFTPPGGGGILLIPGATTDIMVTYDPSSAGVNTGLITINSTDADEATYIINLTGEGVNPAAPKIDVLGNGFSISNNNTPNVLNDTYFGDISIGNSELKTFTIENVGTSDLTITSFFSAGTDFSFSPPGGGGIILAPGETTSIDVTFTPQVSGVKFGTITINSTDPDEATFIINVAANGVSGSLPEIDITGNGVSIIGDGSNMPSTLDDTDFGSDVVGNVLTKTFTINNTGTADLVLTDASPYVTITGVDAADFSVTGIPTTPISTGSSTTFDIEFNTAVIGVKTAVITVNNNDTSESSYTFNIQAEATAGIPLIEVQGNGVTIVNGDATPDLSDDTDFGIVQNNTSKTNTFTIFNNGTADLDITSIVVGLTPIEYSVSAISETLPFAVIPGESMTFDVTFNPVTTGNYQTTVTITSSDSSSNPFQYVLSGDSSDVVSSGDIMFTQYYNGTSGSNWVEIKNISGATIAADTYKLAYYEHTLIPVIGSVAPTAFESIPVLADGEVILFKNTTATLPTSGNLGAVTIIATTVCDFNGDDVVLISKTTDTSCYGNREDVLGDLVSTWGEHISLIRGASSSETPNPIFDINDWMLLSPSGDVDVANIETNIALGVQGVGITDWNAGVWSNLSPDKTRAVTVSDTYIASNGNIEAYNLTVNTGANLNFDSGTVNSVVVSNDLTIEGSFVIGDQESLVTLNDLAVITGVITKVEKSTARNNPNDYTYWSSSVASESFASVFAGVDRFYKFEASLQVSDTNDPDYYAPWVVPTGTMTPGVGYAAQGLSGSSAIHNISFTGVPNNGLITFDIYATEDGDSENDYNLIGNPYPSAIDIERFYADNNQVVGGTIYLWTHHTAISGGDSGDFTNSDYATYNSIGGIGTGPDVIPTKNIGSGQGFFIQAVKSDLIQFNNSMRLVDENNQFFKTNNLKNKSEQKDRIWLDLTTDRGGFKQLLIGFVDEATVGVDAAYDGLGLKSNNVLSFYSHINKEKYVIQGLPTFNVNQTVQLGFDTDVAPRTMTISINNLEGVLKDIDIYLVDNMLGITHNLKEANYSFEQVTVGENSNRFTLKFSNQTLDVKDDVIVENSFVVSNGDTSLKITSSKKVTSLKVYDLLGRQILNDSPNAKDFEVNTSSTEVGTVLIIEAILEDGTVVNKKTMKY